MATPIEPSGSIKFDDQTFLISYFSDLVPFYGSRTYTHAIPLNNNLSIPMSELIAIFNGTSDISQFLKLKTHQYSALVPRVRLYRVDYDESGNKQPDKEFIFNKDYQYQLTDIFKPVKRDNSGIKRINWRLAGSNPVTAEKQIEVEIEFYFDSISSFSSGDFDAMRQKWSEVSNVYNPRKFDGFTDTETTTRNYWTLLFHPKIQGEPAAVTKDKYNTNVFRIRANVGWEEVESNVTNQLFEGLDINEEIQKLNYSFLLNLVEHKFNFNEDGSIGLTATYIASFENSTHNYSFNLLGPLKEKLDTMKNVPLSTLTSGGSFGDLNFIGAINPDILPPGTDGVGTVREAVLQRILRDTTLFNSQILSTLDETQKTELNEILASSTINDIQLLNQLSSDPNKIDCLIGLLNPAESGDLLGAGMRYLGLGTPDSIVTSINSSEQITSEISTVSENLNRLLSLASEREKMQYYKELINKLITTNNIFVVKVDKSLKQDWDSWALRAGIKPSLPSDFLITSPIPTIAISALTESESGINLEGIFNSENIAESINNVVERDTNKAVKFEQNIKYIAFTSLGNIIETAFKLIEEYVNANPILREEIKKIIILCGNISNETKILNIAESATDVLFRSSGRNILDIPIDIRLLKLFLIENIVKPQKDTYTLFSFIKDLITKLAVGVLNGSNLYNNQTNVYTDTSLATNIFTLGDNERGIDPMPYYLLPAIQANESERLKLIIKDYYINNINKHNNYYNYFLIYDKSYQDFYPSESLVEDEKMGIYHYTVGEDFGLLKAANFSRIDTPYLKEAKAVGKKTLYLGQFRDRYNADLTMVGNNIYYPGMMLYIQPSAEALFTVTRDINSPSFAQISGIGGYYFVEKVDSTISEEGYETKLSCIWQSDGTEKPPEKVNGATECDTIFENSSAKSLFNLIYTKLLNNAEIAAAEAAEAEE